MKLKINNVRISLRQEQTLEQAVCRKCGIPRDALGSVRIVRKAVDARKKNDICLNYHVLAEVETGGRQAKRLLADSDITQYQEQQQPTLELGTLPLSAPPVVIGAGPAGLLAALQLAEHGYKPLLLERGKGSVFVHLAEGIIDGIRQSSVVLVHGNGVFFARCHSFQDGAIGIGVAHEVCCSGLVGYHSGNLPCLQRSKAFSGRFVGNNIFRNIRQGIVVPRGPSLGGNLLAFQLGRLLIHALLGHNHLVYQVIRR